MNTKINEKIAIVLPVYNTARYLPECLDSLLRQTFKRFTVFAVNDGSTDASGDILNSYAARDSRIVVINKVNGGVSSARNAALDALISDGSYSYVCFVDSDDVVSDFFLANFIETAIENDAEYCVCGYETYNKERCIQSRVVKQEKICIDAVSAIKHFCQIGEWAKSASNICMTTRFFRTSLIGSTRFNTELVATEDQDFVLRVLTKLRKGILMSDVLYYYRQRASSLSHSKTLSTVQSSFLLARNLLASERYTFPQEVRSGLELRVCDCWWQEARRVYLYGNKEERLAVKKFLLFIREHCNLNILPKKYKKRFFIFLFGDFTIYAYFKLLEKRKKRNFMYE